MGNKVGKKRCDSDDNGDNARNPTTIDRIITKLHLRPTAWKSESHLNQKHVNRSESNSKDPTDKENIINTKPLSKSSDWTNVDLEVPDKDPIHLRNPKLSIIFNNEDGTPTPPPRKHKKGFREKIEAVAKSGLQAFQSKKPVEEEVCVKKKINFNCPYCDGDAVSHNRDHKHHHNHDKKHDGPNEKEIEGMILNNNSIRNDNKKLDKDSKRRKNLSVVSLPNYSDLKLTVATFDDIDKKPTNEVKRNSVSSLHDTPKKLSTASSTGKLDNYITRCRSFGSLIPQQLMGKLKSRKVTADIESDDSFGALEDWDLRIIEHYNPKDASLPRVRKTPEKNVLSDIESLVVHEEDVEKPTPPVRRSESLLKKINREAAQSALKRSNEMLNKEQERAKSVTPPPSPVPKIDNRLKEAKEVNEHSGLMKILEQFSMKDASKGEKKQSVLDLENIPHIDDDVSDEYVLRFERNKPVSPTIEKAANDINAFIKAEGVDTLSRYNNNKNTGYAGI